MLFGNLKEKKKQRRLVMKAKFTDLISRYMESEEVQKMNAYIQHGNTTTLQHCRNVAWISFSLNERLRLKAREKDLIEAAILHDYYLYDWHDGDPGHKWHGYTHPYKACKLASETFHISERAQASIRSHMWPLNIREIPNCTEAVLICLADKYCACMETLKIKVGY